ncbi:hypothetical protein O3M35_009524 [Rhynocoris fuscipes]|uniref:Uncharacterized protein n=1 Tax=Rhynocoris fuscipes TaxID=488301 RepID=A0AAW1D384_9HEMI
MWNRKMCLALQMKWHPCLADGVQKLIKFKFGNIRMEYKIFLSWLKPFLKYGRHKICNFELFGWQHCYPDSLEILI